MSALHKAGIGVGIGLAALALVGLGRGDEDAPEPRAVENAPELPLRCELTRGDTAAFTFESRAALDGEAEPTEDLFGGELSWVVDDVTGESALLRAQLRSVRLEQTLSREQASADELEGSPFYVRIDSRCRFTGLGFAPGWSASSRRLVTALLDGFEIVLPSDDATRWEVEQQDGVGAFAAHYRVHESGGEQTVVRSKPGYRLDEDTQQAGIRVQLLGARAEARFDPARPGWMRSVEGQERVRFLLPGEEPQGFLHRFHIARDDARYLAVRDGLSLGDADFTDALALEDASQPAVDPAMAALDHETVRSRFLALFQESGRSAVYPAARLLAAWLQAHPDESGLLLSDLREGAIDPEAHSALFLALELAGTDASRGVLAEALVDPALTEVDSGAGRDRVGRPRHTLSRGGGAAPGAGARRRVADGLERELARRREHGFAHAAGRASARGAAPGAGGRALALDRRRRDRRGRRRRQQR